MGWQRVEEGEREAGRKVESGCQRPQAGARGQRLRLQKPRFGFGEGESRRAEREKESICSLFLTSLNYMCSYIPQGDAYHIV